MLDIIAHGDITELQMNRPPANALNHELLEAIIDGQSDAVESGVRALILSGQPGMFCAGIDVPELLGQPRADMLRFWSLLFNASRSLALSPVPVVAALAGHSPAGGAVLAAHCDFRIASAGACKIGFNEVQVGLPLPLPILRVFEDLVGPRTARQLGLRGQLMSMDRALDIGLVDELVLSDSLHERVLEFTRELLALPPAAMNRTRLAGKEHLVDVLGAPEHVDYTTDAWFSDETQAAMRQLVDRLSKSE